MSLAPMDQIPASVCRDLRLIFCDIDDTLTSGGLLPAAAYPAVWAARDAGLLVVPVTGRPAGWCDHLARMWPVAAVVGENGGLAFAMSAGDQRPGQIRRLYAPREPGAEQKLEAIRREVLARVPGCKVAADQSYREYDLAMDFCEEVPALDEADVDRIVEIYKKHGAHVKVSSIHVNGWFGDFDKLSMCRRCCPELLGFELDPERATFVGDSPNDEPMFGHFPHAVGVANVRRFAHRMQHLPGYITEAEGGQGFAEFMGVVLDRRR